MNLRPMLVLALLPLLALPARANAQTDSQRYAQACRAAIGAIPAFSCADGAVVPITIDGNPAPPVPQMTCDRPALLSNGSASDGQCVPNSRILSLSTGTMQAVAMCRQKKIRPAGSRDYDEIDVIGHNPSSGATCWFQAVGKAGQPVNGTHVPSPTGEASGDFWNAPQATARDTCGGCHDSGPFMYSPFVGQVWSRMPADPFGPYFHVDPGHFGFSDWPTEALSPRDNTCLGCHRIGVGQTCGSLTLWMTGRAIPEGADMWARRFPGFHGMPPGIEQTIQSWDNIYESSVDQIVSCCQNPHQQMCMATKIPGGPH
jgi:hypothetical protein